MEQRPLLWQSIKRIQEKTEYVLHVLVNSPNLILRKSACVFPFSEFETAKWYEVHTIHFALWLRMGLFQSQAVYVYKMRSSAQIWRTKYCVELRFRIFYAQSRRIVGGKSSSTSSSFRGTSFADARCSYCGQNESHIFGLIAHALRALKRRWAAMLSQQSPTRHWVFCSVQKRTGDSSHVSVHVRIVFRRRAGIFRGCVFVCVYFGSR